MFLFVSIFKIANICLFLGYTGHMRSSLGSTLFRRVKNYFVVRAWPHHGAAAVIHLVMSNELFLSSSSL